MRRFRCLAALGAFVAVFVVAPIVYIETGCRPAGGARAGGQTITLPPITEANYKRQEAKTYFTFPEWYIVYSFEDFGKSLDSADESAFPYLSQIFGFWRSFCTINRIVDPGTESLSEVKTMIYVIGISYSVEYAIKGVYENTIGRVAEAIRGAQRTPQDIYARSVTQDYAAFLYTVPWYKYPFRDKLKELLSLSAPTPSVFRSWERKIALSAEYAIKTGYAWAIQKLLDASGNEEAREIMLVVATLPPDVLAGEPRIKVLRQLSADWQLVIVPRYKDFTEIVAALSRKGIQVAEVAGNHQMLITAIAPKAGAIAAPGVEELFSLDLEAKPGYRRVGLNARVDQLVQAIRGLEAANASIEHLYDY